MITFGLNDSLFRVTGCGFRVFTESIHLRTVFGSLFGHYSLTLMRSLCLV